MIGLKVIPGGKARVAARAEAAAWIARLHGPGRTPEMEAGFRRWLAENSEHAVEFESLSEVWELVADLPAQRKLRHLGRARSMPRKFGQAALVLVACGLAAFGVYWLSTGSQYSTDIGEQRIVLLDDGTRVTLNSNTWLRSAYNDSERIVDLRRGEAFFEVVHDARRPFRVVAGEHRVTAIGTSFVVRYETNQTAVTLVEGKVTVDRVPALSEATASENLLRGSDSALEEVAAVVLEPGERLVLTAARVEQIDRPLVDTLTAWRRGEVVLNDTPLGEAIAEMNRYSETQITIDEADISVLPISGLYHTGDSEGFAVSVARLHGLQIHEQGGSIHLRSR